MKKTTIHLEKLNYVETEEVKTLRTNIMFCGKEKRVIMVTSSVMGEGKSTTAIRLAASLAEVKKNVLLIDLDLRQSVLPARMHATDVDKGMSHFLSGQNGLSDVVMATNISRLHVIFAGRYAPNPTELLSSSRFQSLISYVRNLYDYIILDVPPLGMVVDAAIVAQQCDGAILVLESGTVKYRLAQETKKKIEEAGCPVLGAVLTKVDRRQQGRYYGKYYGKYYGHQEAEVEQPPVEGMVSQKEFELEIQKNLREKE